MRDGNANPTLDMGAKLRRELKALERQRDQYSLAMEAATDAKVAIRLQRTLERIEDEIQGLGEAVRALPSQPDRASRTGWDEETTATYDVEDSPPLPEGAVGSTPPLPLGAPDPAPEPLPDAEGAPTGRFQVVSPASGPGSVPAPAAAEPASPFGPVASRASVAGDAWSLAEHANPVSVLDDDVEGKPWGWGARLALVAGLGVFLAGVFYVLSIN